jgi:hypothetical protein
MNNTNMATVRMFSAQVLPHNLPTNLKDLNNFNFNLVSRLKKEYSYTSTPPVGHHGMY